ncbi:MAG TPA: ATP-binding cassette domain-containing protein [Victivallales bacterium]|nr:ATP-binding cassette domain-containing protein [Victivallales bacterium]
MINLPVLEVKNLTIGYGDTVVLDKINFSVENGEVFIIMGGSGCGKSTLLKNIIGLIPPFCGDILINGKSIITVSKKEKQCILRDIGVTFQAGALFGSLSLGENISLLLEEYTDLNVSERKDVIHEKLRLVGLEEFVDFMPAEISGGMRKRAGLARAMSLDPKLLFFDEPSAGLDPISSAGLDRLILKLVKETGSTVVVVTHELDSIFTIADRAIVLNKKRKGIVASDNPHVLYKKTQNEWVKKFLARDGLGRQI